MNKPQIVAAPEYPIPEWFPKGTTASRCTGCGEIALNVPGNLTDPWKKHFDYCPTEEDSTKGKHGPVYHGGAYPMDIVSKYPTEMTSTWQAHWNGIEEIHEWLNLNPAEHSDPVLWQVLKITEELGEVAQELIACAGQNPRKPKVDRDSAWDKVIDELCDVVVTSMVALRRATPYASDRLQEHMIRILERING